jgi:Zn-dependent peptidase ImmA (M78 family)
VARTLRGSDDVDAFSRPFVGRPVVVLAADKKDRARSRFDAAHELGHLVMHLHAVGSVKQVEDQAHEFASEFLMPAEEIRSQLPVRLDWDRLVKLKFRWGVSIKALLMRTRSLGVMPEGTYVRAMKLYSSKGWSKGEPGDLGPPEGPRLLQKAAEVVYGSGVSPTELAIEAKLTVSEVERLLGEAGDIRPQLELGDEMFSATIVDATSRLNPGG